MQQNNKKRKKLIMLHYTINKPLPCLIVLSGLMFSSLSFADEYFNPALLSGNPDAVADLSRYDKGEGQPVGIYLVDIYLNKRHVGTQNISFDIQKKGQGKSGLSPCLSRTWLSKEGVNVLAIPSLASYSENECVDIVALISQAQTEFDFERQTLNISIPQALLKNNYRGYIQPEMWNEGIVTGILNYRFSGSNLKRSDSGNDTNYFLNLTSGLNIGAWRLRNEGSWNYYKTKNETNQDWNNIRTYVQRAIIPLKSNLTLGDSFTDSDIFDSIGFRGMRLNSDDGMLPDSLRGFAPTVRGIANSNAQVTIEQNGYVIYQTYVPPGAFEIKDLYPTSNSGDLKVIVKEANGSSSQFTVPYSAVPLLQRENRLKYAVTVGEYRSGSDNQEQPKFAQATLLLGLRYGWTIYEGIQIAQNHQSFSIGVGKNLGVFGAFSADITHANSKLPDDSREAGQSLRFLYAKSLNEMGTNFQLLGYRYSTEGFYSFAETTYKQMNGYQIKTQDGLVDITPELINYHNLYYTKKGRIQANISQQLGDYGSVYVLGSYQSYWNTNQKDELLQIGYNGNFNDINFNVNASLNKSYGINQRDKLIALSMSIPLDKWFSAGGGKARDITSTNNTAYATYTTTYDQSNKASQQVGVSGSLLEGNNLNYSVQQGYINQGYGNSGNATLEYKGGSGNVNAGYSYAKNWQQLNYGVSGGILLHENGLTLSQPLGETNILIKAPDAANVSVENITGVKTDWRGYAVVPYATPYRENRVALNTNSLSDDTEIVGAVTQVVPTSGAVVRAEFTTQIGSRALLTLLQSNGKAIPFGATVQANKNGNMGIVGDNGQVFLSGLEPTGKLQVSWGTEVHQQCFVTYQLLPQEFSVGLYSAKARCE
ncbi:fimbrial biogenesis usher protein [Providencia sp. Je.9.19]|uniref:fimbrial biogenesis usher protein n=1 Tax=Providencia sp. Je.9.19 TaxID=3142844 RepID=UPI003DA7B52D